MCIFALYFKRHILDEIIIIMWVPFFVILACIFCFSFKGQIRYEMVGMYPAPLFFKIDAVSGNVILSQSLMYDSMRTVVYKVRTLFDSVAF